MDNNNMKLALRRKKLMEQVAQVGPFIEGTLAVTQRMCGAKECLCQRGKKHEAMYLTWKEEGKTRSIYVPVSRQKEALLMSLNYKKLKKLIRSISDLHKEALIHKETM